MDDLQGGTLALEHRYEVIGSPQRRGPITSYHARQDPFDRQVWVRVYEGLSEERAEDPARAGELADQLKQRAQLGSTLHHPGVLRVVDYGELKGRVPFVISERAPHESLGELLEREGTLSAELVCDIIERAAELLGPIHRERLAHGGLSASCIYLDPADPETLSIGQFQLNLTPAELQELGGEAQDMSRLAPYSPEFYPTQPDDAPADEAEQREEGRDHYPRQGALGADAMTPAGDIWALGVLAYTALVGIHPFFDAEHSLKEGIETLRSKPARPLEQLGVEGAISAVIMRALSSDPRARFLNGSDLASALRAARGDSSGENERGASSEESAKSAQNGSNNSSDNAGNKEQGRALELGTTPATLDAGPPREPGPSDRLLSVAIGLLILTNLAWLFFVVAP